MNLAFWYWEYQRRNPAYIRWVSNLDRLWSELEPYVDTLDELSSPDSMVDMIAYEREATTLQERKHNPFRQVMEDRHGAEAGLNSYRYGQLNNKCEQRFKRSHLSPEYGVDTEELLQYVLGQEHEVNYKYNEISFVSALLNMHNDWIVTIDGQEPSHITMLLHPFVTLPIGPHVTTEIHQKATLEYEVLHFMSNAMDIWDFNNPEVDEETADAALELLTDLDNVNTANTMRLAMLWLWDRIEEDDDDSLDFDSKFQKHWGVLKDRANSVGLTEAPWNQIYDKKKRVLTALQNTNDCIMQMKIIDLNTKR